MGPAFFEQEKTKYTVRRGYSENVAYRRGRIDQHCDHPDRGRAQGQAPDAVPRG
jgi:hypothetical protein